MSRVRPPSATLRMTLIVFAVRVFCLGEERDRHKLLRIRRSGRKLSQSPKNRSLSRQAAGGLALADEFVEIGAGVRNFGFGNRHGPQKVDWVVTKAS